MNINIFNQMLTGLTLQQKAGWGVNGLIIGLGSVFTILIILIVVINLLKLSSKSGSNGKKAKEVTVSSEKTPAQDTEDENESIAAIAAAINCMAQREGKRFAIKSYRRIGSRTKRSY